MQTFCKLTWIVLPQLFQRITCSFSCHPPFRLSTQLWREWITALVTGRACTVTIRTRKVMKISFLPTGIRTVCPSSTPASRKGGGEVILHCNPHATGIPTASLLRSLAIPPQQHLRSRHKTCEWKAQQAPLQEMQQHTAVPQRWLLPPSRGAPLHSFITSIPTEFFQETHQPEAYWAASTSYWRTTCCHQGSLKASSLQSHFSFFFSPCWQKQTVNFSELS